MKRWPKVVITVELQRLSYQRCKKVGKISRPDMKRENESNGPTMTHFGNTNQQKDVGISTVDKRMCANTSSHN